MNSTGTPSDENGNEDEDFFDKMQREMEGGEATPKPDPRSMSMAALMGKMMGMPSDENMKKFLGEELPATGSMSEESKVVHPDEMEQPKYDFEDWQIEIAREMRRKILEHIGIRERMEKLHEALAIVDYGNEVRKGKRPPIVQEQMVGSPFGGMMVVKKETPPTTHPLFEMRYKVARLMDDETSEEVLRERVLEDIHVETLLLGKKGAEIMQEINELAQSL